MASDNPDALVRSILRARNAAQRGEDWALLQNLGSDEVLKRAESAIQRTDSPGELEAVLSAAIKDHWPEVLPFALRRFRREQKSAAKDRRRIHALLQVIVAFNGKLSDQELRALLKSGPIARNYALQLIVQQNRALLVDDCRELCLNGKLKATELAADVVAQMGDSYDAATIWTRVLNARHQKRNETVLRLLRILARMGAFDIMLALRNWIAEDAIAGGDIWKFGVIWAQLAGARFSAEDYSESEARDDIRWFVRIAPPPTRADQLPAALELAALLVEFRVELEAEKLLHTLPLRDLALPDEFPEALVPVLRRLTPQNPELSRKWEASLRDGQWPEQWSSRRLLEENSVTTIFRRVFQAQSPGVLRAILTRLSSDPFAVKLLPELEKLARGHRSAIVRWKARRIVRQLNSRHASLAGRRWVRLDAAVLSGAIRAGDLMRPPEPERRAERTGIVHPEKPGQGYKLDFSNLAAHAREATLRELLKAPMSHALHRRLPLGLAFEERPDVRASREFATPAGPADEKMIELAGAVIEYWGDVDEPLTLDEDGLGMMAAGLSAEGAVLDDDDVVACGAFIGEVLRKHLGGQWTGFDENYRLEIEDELFDPLGWARVMYSRKNIVEAAQFLTERFCDAVNRLAPERRFKKFHRDPSEALERTIRQLCSMPPRIPMCDLVSEARVLSYRLDPAEWPAVVSIIDPLLETYSGARAVAAITLYAPGEVFARGWARWGVRKRERSGLIKFLVEAMIAAAAGDDMEAMPNWTVATPSARYSFLNPLRKKMPPESWRHVLMLLLKQRAAAGDRAGVAWCLYSYKYEFSDILPLIEIFTDMSVSARQTIVRAATHPTRDEIKLFRPLWAEALRDPSPVIAMAALEAAQMNRARSLRPLVKELIRDKRIEIASAAEQLLAFWKE